MSVPPLTYLCVQLASQVPHLLYRVFGSLKLAPSFDLVSPHTLSPCVWASIVQIFNQLPPSFITYPIHLLHNDMTLLLHIPQTPHFSLLTLLELPGCIQVTDDSISRLFQLHSLVAVDLSGTKISYLAIKRLAQYLTLEGSGLGPRTWRGPWPLRILRLYNCRNIDNLIFPSLSKFPLICVLDLRGTRCVSRPGLLPPEWKTITDNELFFPSSLSTAVDTLSQSSVWSSQSAFKLLINTVDLDQQQVGDLAQQTSGVSASLFYGKTKTARHDPPMIFNKGKQSLVLQNSELTLHRIPPPWSALDDAVLNHARDKMTEKPPRKVEETVVLKNGARQQAAMTKLQELAMRRKEMVNSSSTEMDKSSLQKRESKNPFLRRRI
ncbi:hypothetical protein JOM56_003544 [Amanita muscaria]